MSWQIDEFLQSQAAVILNAFGDAVSIHDPSLTILYQNSKHKKLMGDQTGKKCYEGYQQRADVCPGCHLLTAFAEKRTVRRIGSSRHSRRGGLCHVEITAFPLFDETGSLVAGIEAIRDITEQTLMDERLRLITCDLEEKSWKLMSANRELESFNYTLSHDVRNYLSRISIAADAFTNDAAAFHDGTAGFLLKSIVESVSALDEMIDAILRLSLAGQSGVAQEEVDLGVLAEEVAAELRTLHPDHPVALEVGAGLDLKGDRQLLKVMLRNLLGNAWKYTQSIPAPRVTFAVEEHGGNKIFAIRDNGIGFDMKESGRLFKPFSRLSNSAAVKGSGIGLATARRVILCHGGELWAEGTPGGGAAFFFAIPLPQG